MVYRNVETVLQDLCSLPKEAVYCLINEKDKRVQVFQTSNLVSHIGKLVLEIGSLNNKNLRLDLNNIKLLIVETKFENKESRNNVFKKTVEKYKKLGYEFYNELSVAQYKLKESFQYRNHKAYYVIELVGAKGSKPIVVGVFTKWREARTFQDKEYPNGCIEKVVFADNEDTKNWNF
jgi:hypothetical protein